MINYSTWPKKKISTTSLRLDLNNPRLSETTKRLNQSEIIDYLIENEKVYELATSIVTKGYFLNEQPIVVKENNKYHVLEGNRRVSASKILINPDLIKSPTRRSTIKKHLKTFDLAIIEKLECIIAPTREDADVMIVNRHTGGSAVEKWDKTKQDRFLYNRFMAGESIDLMSTKFPISKNEIKNSIKRYNVYKELSSLPLDDGIKKALLDETTFSMTNVERVYQFKDGLTFLGFEFDQENYSLIKKLPKEEFVKRMSKIATDVINGNINSRKLNDDSDKRQYFQDLRDSGDFDISIPPDVKYNIVDDEEKSIGETILPANQTTKASRTKTSSNKLMSSNLYLDTGVQRIDEIFYELKSLNVKNTPNAVGVLFRSYLDMLVYQFLKKKSELEQLKQSTVKRLKEENDKKFKKIKSNLIGLNGDMLDGIEDNDLKITVGINDSFARASLVPSLREMLSHISTSENLIPDDKLKQALQGYIRNNNEYLGHHDFNLLVHNEYYPADSEELKKAWNQIYPILDYFVIQIKQQ